MYNSLPTLHGVILAHDHERVGFQTRHWCARKSTYILLIFITAHDGEVTRSRPLKTDVVGCLREPFSGEALLDAARSALESEHDSGWRPSGSRESPP
jgi:DNA-binding response OmpR family regulator